MITAEQAREKVLLSWSENDLQTHVLGLAQSTGWLAYHTYDSRRSQKGYPDLHLIHPRRRLSIFRELKSQKGRVTPDQRTWIDGLLACGQDAGIWRPSDLVSGVIVATLQGKGIG